MKYINKAFFKFSNFKNFKEFKKKHSCICELFVSVEGENYLKPTYKDGESWITHMLANPHEEFFAMMKNKENINTLFKATIKYLEGDEYLISLNDITMYQENMNFINIVSNMNGVYFTVTDMSGDLLSISKSFLDEINITDFEPKKYNINATLNEQDSEKTLRHIRNNDSSSYEITVRTKEVVMPLLVQGYFGIINNTPVRVSVAVDLREIKKLQKKTKQQDLLIMQQA